MFSVAGSLDKLEIRPRADGQAQYHLALGAERVALNTLLETQLHFRFNGKIHCSHCAKLTMKSFAQGYCYACFIKLAQCDSCIMAPEKCHHHLGTCREPDWAAQICFAPHIVYLANSSGVKVGITRATQMPTRWLDQGAVQALPIVRVASRRLSGLIEDLFRQQVADKTSWQKLLKGDAPSVDLVAQRDALFAQFAEPLAQMKATYGDHAIELLDVDEQRFSYPVLSYPTKVVSHNFDKDPSVSGRLLGLKGQYLLLDTGVINLRKFTSYQVSFACSD